MKKTQKEFALVARGSSMTPTIRDGDKIKLKQQPPETLRVGDVVFCIASDGRPVAHRIVFIKRKDGTRHFGVKGDNIRGVVDVLGEERVIGKVCQVSRGRKIMRLTSPPLLLLERFLGFISPLHSLIYPFLASMKRHIVSTGPGNHATPSS